MVVAAKRRRQSLRLFLFDEALYVRYDLSGACTAKQTVALFEKADQHFTTRTAFAIGRLSRQRLPLSLIS